jgi:hypothetical protein
MVKTLDQVKTVAINFQNEGDEQLEIDCPYEWASDTIEYLYLSIWIVSR